jgi:hypothetical protein
MHESMLERQSRVSRKTANACSLWFLYSGSRWSTHQEVLMGRNLVCEWQRVQLQPAIDNNPIQLHVPDKNAVPDHGSLFDMRLVLSICFSLFEPAVELLRIEMPERSSGFRRCDRDVGHARLQRRDSHPQLPSSILCSLRSRIRCKYPHAGLAHHAYTVRDVSLHHRLSGQMRRCHAGTSDSVEALSAFSGN